VNWFEQFIDSLQGKQASLDLQGAALASSEQAMRHYRFQHQAKVREAIEDTFFITKKILGNNWEDIWNQFWMIPHETPRSLDYVSEVFLKFLNAQDYQLELRELARFEYLMDIHPWTHESLPKFSIASLTDSSQIILHPLDIHEFKTPVSTAYDQEIFLEGSPEKVLFWMTETGVHFRKMEVWELDILQNLDKGIQVALDDLEINADSLSDFFKWLGESNLVREIK